MQKHCRCPGQPHLGCCKSGWQTVFCGSRLNSPAESWYHPIEGEVAAAVHGLNKCSQFLLGHPNVLLALDHKPLIKIFGSCNLEDISNPRLFNFKQHSLKFRFTPVHIPGKQHVVPDTFSRRSDVPSADTTAISNILPGYTDSMGPPDWVAQPLLAFTGLSPPGNCEELPSFVPGIALSKLEMFNSLSQTFTPLTCTVTTTPEVYLSRSHFLAKVRGCM